MDLDSKPDGEGCSSKRRRKAVSRLAPSHTTAGGEEAKDDDSDSKSKDDADGTDKETSP
jgi:hypothetical protein